MPHAERSKTSEPPALLQIVTSVRWAQARLFGCRKSFPLNNRVEQDVQLISQLDSGITLSYCVLAVGRIPTQTASTSRVVDDLNLGVPVAVTAEIEGYPGRVVARVLLHKDPIGIGSADEVVESWRRSRDIKLLTLGGLVVLIHPPWANSLVGAVAFEEESLSGRRVIVELDPIDQAEGRLDRVLAEDRTFEAADAYLEESHSVDVPVVMLWMKLELAYRLLTDHIAVGIQELLNGQLRLGWVRKRKRWP